MPSPILNLMIMTRMATADDTALLTAHRRAMFAAMPNPDFPVLETMSSAFEPWVRERIAEGKYLGWIVEDGARVAASAGLLIVDWPPHPFHPESNQRAYLLNVFVEPEYRRRGLAHDLIERGMAEAQARNPRRDAAQLRCGPASL
jgi:ribosomal protein S18 acetylase RimI-like enzyme